MPGITGGGETPGNCASLPDFELNNKRHGFFTYERRKLRKLISPFPSYYKNFKASECHIKYTGYNAYYLPRDGVGCFTIWLPMWQVEFQHCEIPTTLSILSWLNILWYWLLCSWLNKTNVKTWNVIVLPSTLFGLGNNNQNDKWLSRRISLFLLWTLGEEYTFGRDAFFFLVP